MFTLYATYILCTSDYIDSCFSKIQTIIRIVVFRIMTPHGVVSGYKNFGERYCIHPHGDGMFLRYIRNHLADYTVS
jgi:hypothetical protein